jgi:hypothetical protein
MSSMRARVYQRLLIPCFVTIAAAHVASAQAKRSGTWAASNANGQTFVGTWTALSDSTGKAVTGTWTLGDPRNSPVAGGAWSAAKAATEWNGAWRAIVTGRQGELSGTWKASTDVDGSAGFTSLIEKAVEAAVNGTWQMGPQSGAWSIRAAQKSESP